MQFEELTMQPERLLLDPNNYRFHDLDSYKPVVNAARFGEPGVQARALQLLQSTASFELDALKDSIETNGYVPLEQIVVEIFDKDESGPRYLIIEGNRRAAAIKTLISEQKAGVVDIPADKLRTITEFRALQIIGNNEERAEFKRTLMAIRHVAGVREWGPYQQAKLVVELFEQENHQFGRVAQRVGISSREVARRYRAARGLQQMEEDDEFGEHASPQLYSFFHEAVSQPKVREWLGFSDSTFLAENEEARRNFYELLSPRNIDSTTYPPKLQNANRQVRQLKNIVDKAIPLKFLLDPEKSFDDAVQAAEDETLEDAAGILEHSLALALRSLREPSIDAWLSPNERVKEIWKELVDLVAKIRPIMEEGK